MPAAAHKLRLPSPDEQILARQAFRRIQSAPDHQAPVRLMTPQGEPLDLPADAAQLILDILGTWRAAMP